MRLALGLGAVASSPLVSSLATEGGVSWTGCLPLFLVLGPALRDGADATGLRKGSGSMVRDGISTFSQHTPPLNTTSLTEVLTNSSTLGDIQLPLQRVPRRFRRLRVLVPEPEGEFVVFKLQCIRNVTSACQAIAVRPAYLEWQPRAGDGVDDQLEVAGRDGVAVAFGRAHCGSEEKAC